MDQRLGVSTAYTGVDKLCEKMQLIKDAGFSYLELTELEDNDKTRAMLNRLNGVQEQTGLKIRSIHLPFGLVNGINYDVSELDEAVREKALRAQLRIVQAAAHLKPEIAVIHASYEPIPELDRAARMRSCVRSLRELCLACKKWDVKVAVECLPRTCLGNTSSDLLTMLREVKENLFVCFDTNHLTAEDNLTFIRNVGPYLLTTHVSDYDGKEEKHWLPTKGVNPWGKLLDALDAVGYEGPAVFEVRRAVGPLPEALAELKSLWDGVLARRVSATGEGGNE